MTTRPLQPWERDGWLDMLVDWLLGADDPQEQTAQSGWDKPCCQYTTRGDADEDGR